MVAEPRYFYFSLLLFFFIFLFALFSCPLFYDKMLLKKLINWSFKIKKFISSLRFFGEFLVVICVPCSDFSPRYILVSFCSG